jgi:hypothetical protein
VSSGLIAYNEKKSAVLFLPASDQQKGPSFEVYLMQTGYSFWRCQRSRAALLRSAMIGKRCSGCTDPLPWLTNFGKGRGVSNGHKVPADCRRSRGTRVSILPPGISQTGRRRNRGTDLALTWHDSPGTRDSGHYDLTVRDSLD